MAFENLLKSQTNEVYLLLVGAKWDPAEFEWSRGSFVYGANAKTAAQLSHKPSEYYFIFGNSVTKYTCKYSPAATSLVTQPIASSWINQLAHFKDWLGYLAREINAPDLWAELPSESKLIESASDDEDNSKFTKEEKKIIIDGLEEIKQYLLKAHKLDPEFVEGQLKYLVESADRLGRKDWKNALVSVIFGIIIQGGIAGHNAQEILQFVWTVLNAVLVQKLYLP
jgi:hypothetical protein